jgi:DNA polymerase (family X)
MVMEAKSLGYQYIAITDHTQRLAFTKGMNKDMLKAQIKQINKLNEKLSGIVILKSAEIDILENGDLDLPDDILKELDVCVCAIHSHFNLPPKKQTERIIKAMDNQYFNIFAHPTGRLINQREPYSFDIDRVMSAAKERHCLLEINAQPERLDLNDTYCKMAKDMQLKFAISTDAHSTSQLHLMRFGVDQARRGWLEASDVINSYSLDQLRRILKR